MLCPWRTSDLGLQLILTIFLEAASSNSCMDGKQTTQNISTILTEVHTLLSRPMDTKAVLCCPLIPLTNMTLVTWEIILEDKPACKLSYRGDTNETRETNCTDKRITWAFRPDQNPDLQIDPVAITHEGNYECIMAASDGNFHRRYHLQVLVPPEMTLFLHKNRTAVCKAVAGRPAARISWSPEGDCVTEQEYWGNGTVTVWSSCRWSDSNVSAVTCSVLHLTGNKSLFIELLPGTKTSVKLYILYLILPIILIIVGSIWFLKIRGYRKCELKKTEVPPVVEEDEMQPYASYTEKSNPLYDTTNRVKVSQVLQSEADGLGLPTV